MMFPSLQDVISWMESKGFVFNREDFRKDHWKVTEVIALSMAISEYCYNMGSVRNDSEGRILNELGEPAKQGEVILRGSESGFPIQKFGKAKIDLKKVEDSER